MKNDVSFLPCNYQYQALIGKEKESKSIYIVRFIYCVYLKALKFLLIALCS